MALLGNVTLLLALIPAFLVLQPFVQGKEALLVDLLTQGADPSIDDVATLDFHNSTDSCRQQGPQVVKPANTWRKSRAQQLAELRRENEWKNELILQFIPVEYRDRIPHFCQSWLRNYVACMGMYIAVGSLWAYYIYYCFGNELFGSSKLPGWKAMSDQIQVSLGAIPLYSLLPACTEWAVEHGYTRAYAHVADVGLPRYLLYFALYMACVEFCVYWMHRLLHDIKPGYKWLHYIHHKYNKENTLSPFAGLAFHPLDGILQAVPYCWTLALVPMHFLTHELLLFATGLWTTNIHDNLHGKVEPVMGAGYHTIHHTTYRHNYGHYFIYMDKLFGTLVSPEEYEKQLAGKDS